MTKYEDVNGSCRISELLEIRKNDENKLNAMLLLGMQEDFERIPLDGLKDSSVQFLFSLAEQIICDVRLDIRFTFLVLNDTIVLIQKAENHGKVNQLFKTGVIKYLDAILEKKEKPHHNLVRSVKKHVQDNLYTKINISDLSVKLGTNASYLSRIFHQKEGITIAQYICNKRIEQAAALFSSSDYSTEEISRVLGFSSISYFGKKLKEQTGMTPNQFRLQCRTKGERSIVITKRMR